MLPTRLPPGQHPKALQLWLLPLVLQLLLLACPAHAERHLSYSYDALGRKLGSRVIADWIGWYNHRCPSPGAAYEDSPRLML